MSNFCREYKSLRFDSAHKEVRSSSVVVEALRNYNSCKLIEARTGAIVTHKFSESGVVISFDLKRNSVLKVQGVIARNLACRVNDAPEGVNKELGEQSAFEMNTNFSIVCRRAEDENANGNTSLKPASVAVATSVDAYVVSLPADTIYNNHLASDATAQIAGLTKSLKEVTENRDELIKYKSRMDDMKVEVASVIVGSPHPGFGGKLYACYTPTDLIKKDICDSAPYSRIDVIQRATGGGHCGYTRYAVVCLRY
jgi:hypothetical protein